MSRSVHFSKTLMVMVGLLGTILFAGCSNFLTDSIGVTGDDNPFGDEGFTGEVSFVSTAIPSLKNQAADETADCGYFVLVNLEQVLAGISGGDTLAFQAVEFGDEKNNKLNAVAGTYIGVLAQGTFDRDSGVASDVSITAWTVQQASPVAGETYGVAVSASDDCSTLSMEFTLDEENIASDGEAPADPTILDGKYSCTFEGESFEKADTESEETFDLSIASVGQNDGGVEQVGLISDDGIFVMELRTRGENIFNLYAYESWTENVYTLVGTEYDGGNGGEGRSGDGAMAKKSIARKLQAGEEAASFEIEASYNVTCERDDAGNLECDFYQEVDYSDGADYYSDGGFAQGSKSLVKSQGDDLDDDLVDEYHQKLSCELVSDQLSFDVHDVILDETTTLDERLTITADQCYGYSSGDDDESTVIGHVLAVLNGLSQDATADSVDIAIEKAEGSLDATFTAGQVSDDFTLESIKDFVWRLEGGDYFENFTYSVDYSYMDFWVDLESGIPLYVDAYISVYLQNDHDGSYMGASCFFSNDIDFYGDDYYSEESYDLGEFESDNGIVEVQVDLSGVAEVDSCGYGQLDLHSVDGIHLYDIDGNQVFASDSYFEYNPSYFGFYGVATVGGTTAYKSALAGEVEVVDAYIDAYSGTVYASLYDNLGNSCYIYASLYGESSFEGEDGSIDFSASAADLTISNYGYSAEGDAVDNCPFLSDGSAPTDLAIAFGSSLDETNIRFESAATGATVELDENTGYQYGGNYFDFSGYTYKYENSEGSTSYENLSISTYFEIFNQGTSFEFEYGYYSMYYSKYDESTDSYSVCSEYFDFDGSGALLE